MTGLNLIQAYNPEYYTTQFITKTISSKLVNEYNELFKRVNVFVQNKIAQLPCDSDPQYISHSKFFLNRSVVVQHFLEESKNNLIKIQSTPNHNPERLSDFCTILQKIFAKFNEITSSWQNTPNKEQLDKEFYIEAQDKFDDLDFELINLQKKITLYTTSKVFRSLNENSSKKKKLKSTEQKKLSEFYKKEYGFSDKTYDQFIEKFNALRNQFIDVDEWQKTNSQNILTLCTNNILNLISELENTSHQFNHAELLGFDDIILLLKTLVFENINWQISIPRFKHTFPEGKKFTEWYKQRKEIDVMRDHFSLVAKFFSKYEKLRFKNRDLKNHIVTLITTSLAKKIFPYDSQVENNYELALQFPKINEYVADIKLFVDSIDKKNLPDTLDIAAQYYDLSACFIPIFNSENILKKLNRLLQIFPNTFLEINSKITNFESKINNINQFYQFAIENPLEVVTNLPLKHTRSSKKQLQSLKNKVKDLETGVLYFDKNPHFEISESAKAFFKDQSFFQKIDKKTCTMDDFVEYYEKINRFFADFTSIETIGRALEFDVKLENKLTNLYKNELIQTLPPRIIYSREKNFSAHLNSHSNQNLAIYLIFQNLSNNNQLITLFIDSNKSIDLKYLEVVYKICLPLNECLGELNTLFVELFPTNNLSTNFLIDSDISLHLQELKRYTEDMLSSSIKSISRLDVFSPIELQIFGISVNLLQQIDDFKKYYERYNSSTNDITSSQLKNLLLEKIFTVQFYTSQLARLVSSEILYLMNYVQNKKICNLDDFLNDSLLMDAEKNLCKFNGSLLNKVSSAEQNKKIQFLVSKLEILLNFYDHFMSVFDFKEEPNTNELCSALTEEVSSQPEIAAEIDSLSKLKIEEVTAPPLSIPVPRVKNTSQKKSSAKKTKIERRRKNKDAHLSFSTTSSSDSVEPKLKKNLFSSNNITTSRKFLKILFEAGFKEMNKKRGHGSHQMFINSQNIPVVVPKKLKKGTAYGIMKTAGIELP